MQSIKYKSLISKISYRKFGFEMILETVIVLEDSESTYGYYTIWLSICNNKNKYIF